MKKLLFMTAVAAIAMTSCSKDEKVEVNNGGAIDFRAAMQTRAVVTGNSNLTKIYVTALQGESTYFKNIEYGNAAGAGAGNFFTSSAKYYWPSDETAVLSFYAYSPALSTSAVTAASDGIQAGQSTDGKKLTDVVIASKMENQVDLIAATATGTKQANEESGVELQFKHLLSQVEILAKNSNAAYTYKVSGVRIAYPYGKIAEIDLSDDTGTNQATEDKGDYIHRYGADTTNIVTLNENAQSVMGTATCAILAPQAETTAWSASDDKQNANKNTYISLRVKILSSSTNATVYEGWAAQGVAFTWEKGKKYVYTLDFSNGAGYVDPVTPDPDDDDPDPDRPGDDDKPGPGDKIFGGEIKFICDVTDFTTGSTNDVIMQ